jgi:hypothetical protein
LIPVVVLLHACEVYAVPILQVYIEGATYDDQTQSWTYVAPGSSGGAPFRLWAVGNVGGPGGKGTIHDVRLAAAYDLSADPLEITLTPGRVDEFDFSGWSDPSDAVAARFRQFGSEGTVPVLGDGRPLPNHSEYGEGIVWQEFALGDFSLTDSPVGDFVGGFPSVLTPKSGQLSVYEVSVKKSVGEPVVVHFDLYNHVQAKNKSKYVFAPFSHDADGSVTIAPEPPSVVLLGVAGCLGGLVWAVRRLGMRRHSL